MNKTILGVSILAIGVGSYFYLSNTGEVKIVKQEVSEKIELNKTMIGKQKGLKKKVVKKKTGIEVIKGYKLPPEPDKTLNDSTLLGIDSNNNMLRDDVERWIVKQPWSHEKIATALQLARGYEIEIRDDIGDNNTKLTLSEMASSVFRARIKREAGGRIISIEKDISLFNRKVFNTKERWTAYMKYDRSFSGTIVHGFPNAGEISYKYADYTMKDGTLKSYKFTGKDRYYSRDDIPLYEGSGLIVSYWSLEKNEEKEFEGDWNDKFCEVNFGISKNGIECGKAKAKYREDFEKGLVK